MPDLWPELIAAALLGTARRAFTPPPATGPLGAALAQIASADHADALLGTAALVAVFQQAGRLPGQAGATLEPSAPDDLPACPPGAVQHLSAMLAGTQRTLLPEWLAALTAAGRRVPPAYLPALLDLGRTQPELCPALLPALGARGAWLAAQNPAWAYVPARLAAGQGDAAELAAAWDTGTRAARGALLIEMRQRTPALARELIQRSWASEKADDRAAFLAAFEHGLSDDDEPLLEGMLDDRSKEVRRTAAGLLARLPTSRLVARMRERAQIMLSWAPAEPARLLRLKGARPAQLACTPPAAYDPAWQRDVIEPKPPAHMQKLGERAWWLQQILGHVPPAGWSKQWGIHPDELIAQAARGDWQHALIEGWRAAALAHRDADWAEALLRHDAGAAELLGALPAERQEALLLDILRGDCTPLHKHPVLELLRKTAHPWSAELTRAVLRTLHRHMRRWRDTFDYQLRGALTDEFARRIPPAMLAELAAGWPDEPEVRERWQGVIDKLLITLQFRHDMLAALRA